VCGEGGKNSFSLSIESELSVVLEVMVVDSETAMEATAGKFDTESS